MWELFDTGTSSAEENMKIDQDLLNNLRPDSSPILHFYDWKEKSLTYGYFIRIEKFLNLDGIPLDIARRPTGGGITFHVSDLAFSVLMPASHPEFSNNPLDNYNFINKAVLKGVKRFFENEMPYHLLSEEASPLDESCNHFCMAKPTIYDVMLEGKKIAGAAQRKKKQGYLHQGTISLAFPNEALLKGILLPDTGVLEAMKQHTFSILGSDWTQSDLKETRVSMRHYLKESLFDE